MLYGGNCHLSRNRTPTALRVDVSDNDFNAHFLTIAQRTIEDIPPCGKDPVTYLCRNLLIYTFLVSESISAIITGCLKRSSGLQDSLAHTGTKQDGGMGRSDPNRLASLFLSYNNYKNYNANVINCRSIKSSIILY